MSRILAGAPGGWPQRYNMMILLLAALLLCYIDRILISVAGIEMQRELGWSDADKGLVFSAFFLGYLCTQLLGGILANRFGGRNVFLLAVLGWSLMTVLTPAAAYAGFTLLVLARFLLGFGEGAAYPSAYNLIYGWMPGTEISRSVGLISAAAALGTVFALLVVGKFIELWGWPSVFYTFGAMGVVWCVLWYFIVPATPVSSQEPDTEAGNVAIRAAPIPWKSFFSHSPILPLYVAFIAFGCVSYTVASWLPSYFVDTYQSGLVQAGAYSILPWLVNAVVTVWAGVLADRWIRGGQSRLGVRKKLFALGMAGTASGCLLLTIASQAWHAVAAVSLLFGSLGITVPGFVPVVGELFPRHGEVLYGFMAATASICSSVVVALTGILLDKTGSYNAVFMLLAVLCTLGIALFQSYASVTPILPEDREPADPVA